MLSRAQEAARTDGERQRELRSSKAGIASLYSEGCASQGTQPPFFASMARDRLSDSVGGSDFSLSEFYAVELREDLRGCRACLAIAVLRTRLLALLLGCKRACSPTATQGGGCEVLRLRGMLCSHGDPREVRPHRTLIARNRSLPPSPINDHEPSMRKTGAAYLATRSPRCTGLLYPLSNYATPAVARHPCEQLPAHGRASERH